MRTSISLICSLLLFSILGSTSPFIDSTSPAAYMTVEKRGNTFSHRKSVWPMACYGPEAKFCRVSCHCDERNDVFCNKRHKDLEEDDRNYHDLAVTGLCAPVCGCKRKGIWVRGRMHRADWMHLRDLHNMNNINFAHMPTVKKNGRFSGD